MKGLVTLFLALAFFGIAWGYVSKKDRSGAVMERATIKMFIDQCNALDLHGAADCIENLAAEVDRLRRQIAIYQRVAQENSGFAVDAMVTQDQIADLCIEIEHLKREVAASQDREQKLREALDVLVFQHHDWGLGDVCSATFAQQNRELTQNARITSPALVIRTSRVEVSWGRAR